MATIILCVAVSTLGAERVAANPVDFAHQVLPLLQKHCAACHTDGTYSGSFSMDTRESLLEAGAVVPGESDESELVRRISSMDPTERMPAEADPLDADQIRILRQWIDQGLPWQEGFSFKSSQYVPGLPPRRPELPAERPGMTHPLDRLLADYLNKHQLALEAADDRTFARRAYLDLAGLLPTPEQLEDFLGDTRPDKRDQLIQRLLADSRTYTEHWLTFWNDLLRNDYSGTGYIDGGRKEVTLWLYQALLDNEPYDQFVRELIHPTAESEGFIKGIVWRGRVNASQVPEVQFAQNVSQVFLGINLKCASCHDSFINQWKLRDAYGMAAVISDQPLEIHRCDKPTGEMAQARFLFPELGVIHPDVPRDERLQRLADLMTHPQNGRLTRTIVNRLWHRLMGRGLVHPVDDMDGKPWNADILDFLAVDLVDKGYDLKQTLHLIASSGAYQSRCAVMTEELSAEPYVFQGPLAKRLTAEQFFDALWSLTATGPTKPDAKVDQPSDRPVRAALVQSTLLMRQLGRPNREQVVTSRPEQLTTLEALDLSNDELLHSMLSQGAQNLLGRFAGNQGDLIGCVYRHALSRDPTQPESDLARQIVGEPPSAEGVADLLWIVSMLPEFQLVR